MNVRKIVNTVIKRCTAFLLCLILTALTIPPVFTNADGKGRIVRVGWHEAPYFITDKAGRRSGYTYDYQQKIASYTGWTYEYVEGSWSELMQKLRNGEIDMMGNVSYTDERAEDILYASLPMGTESYYLVAAPYNQDIKPDDYTSLNGKKIGVTKGTIQDELYRNWAEEHGIRAEIVELTGPEIESVQKIGKDYDAYVTMDVHANNKIAVPIWKIGSSDFFFALSRSARDLLNDLNYAMNRVQDENRFFSQQLYEKYQKNTDTNLYLSDKEKEWLENHGPIRVGYQYNYLAFCTSDEITGELTGALKDYLDYASTALKNAEIEFVTTCYPTAAAALSDLNYGKIDCVFPANMTYSDSEKLGVVMTPPLMSTEMDAVVRASEQKEFIHKEHVNVAVNEGNTNYDLFLEEHFPDWKPKYYTDTPTGLNAVAAGDADCVIISSYRFSNISKQCERLHLTTVYTGVNMDYYFAVRRGKTELYSILSRLTTAVPDAVVHTALTYYSTEDVKLTFWDIIKDNLLMITIVIAVVLAVIMFLLQRSIRAEKKALEEERTINAMSQKVYVDPLTSVRNKGAFAAYIQELQEQVDNDENMRFAICMLDCDDHKRINEIHGHEKGDENLKAVSLFICRIFQHSPVFRIGGDEFAIVLQNDDYRKREELIYEFEKQKKEICAAKDNIWEQIHVSIGVAVYDRYNDKTVNDTVCRADKLMYANKHKAKSKDAV